MEMTIQYIRSRIFALVGQNLYVVNVLFNFVGLFALLLYPFPWGTRLQEWNFAWAMEATRHYVSLTPFKSKLFSDMEKQPKSAGGKRLRILEIGIGCGTNLEFFPKHCELVAVDPNRSFEPFLIENLEQRKGIEWKGYVGAYGEDMSNVETNSIDAVVTSSVSCSIEEFDKVLKEIRRVLVPGGKYYFCEHVLDNQNTWTRKLQWILNVTRWWPFIACGCMFRSVEPFIKSAGFSEVVAYNFYIPTSTFTRNFPMIAPHYQGYAVK